MTRRGHDSLQLLCAGVVLLAVGLSSCATTSAPVQAEKATVVETVCLPQATYTQAQLNDAADELVKLREGDIISILIADYHRMRAENAACMASAK